MDLDLPLVLLALVALSGIIALVDILFFAKTRIATRGEMSWPVDYARSLFPVLLLVLILRSFVFQAFKVPSGSLEPTVMPGDFISVSMYSYGLRLPVAKTKILNVNQLHHGDIAVFVWPINPGVNFVKRVIGLPGDHISYINKVFYVNGKKEVQKPVGTATDRDSPTGPSWPVTVLQENFEGVKHNIYVREEVPGQDFYNLVVPPDHYMMVGDNRDDSNDSRYWGFVSDHLIVGQAKYILFNWPSWLSLPHWQGKAL